MRMLLPFAIFFTTMVPTVVSAQVPAAGSLLVAAPHLGDRNFERSVVLMVHHDDDGSIGVLVNRPTNLSPASVFPDVAELARYRQTLYFGGPVAPAQLLLLLRAPDPGLVESPPLFGDVYVSADPGLLQVFPASGIDAARVRIYAGHAGWGPGQLAAEIARGDWNIVPGRADLVFTAEPLGLWEAIGLPSRDVVARAQRSDRRAVSSAD